MGIKEGDFLTARKTLLPVDGITAFEIYRCIDVDKNMVLIENDISEEKYYLCSLFAPSDFLENPSYENRYLYL